MTVTTKEKQSRYRIGLLLLAAIIATLLLHGAVPLFSIPTLQQAVWTTGFSLSFANDSLLTIYASNFGAPEPAAIAFGLAGAYPAALFINVGLHPADAYAATAALWLVVALLGAWKLGVLLGLHPGKAVVTAFLWMTMPVVWAHSGYSMVSLGLGLLPFYFMAALQLFTESRSSSWQATISALRYFCVCIVAVFMDGYSFMMFATGATLLGTYFFWRFPESRRMIVRYSLPVHAFGLGLAYLLYALYIGKTQFDPYPLDFFRGWGVDLIFLAIPSKGVHWLWDSLGLSVARTDSEFFGDASVWTTTFSVLLILVGFAAWRLSRLTSKSATGFLLIALFGLYMSLGPSLKVNSTRPPVLQQQKPGQQNPMMPAELAVIPTGNSWLSLHVPGFQNMRSSYRWIALADLGFWTLLVLWFSLSRGRKETTVVWFAIAALIASNLPHPERFWKSTQDNRSSFFRLEQELVDELKSELQPGEMVAFLPWSNDFLVNYLASALQIRTYNIGGDKNLAMAREGWPGIMRQFPMGNVDQGFADRVVLLLARGEADAVVLPYIDMLWSARKWPPPLAKYKNGLQPVVNHLRSTEFVEVAEFPHFASVRVLSNFAPLVKTGELARRVARELCLPPMCIRARRFSSTVPTEVGRVEAGRLYTTHRAGPLLYGPYVSMESGGYRIRLSGAMAEPGSAWLDIASSKGTVIHGKFPLPASAEAASNTLVDGDVTLSQPVHDLEVRVFVGAEDQVRLDGFELVPIGPNERQPTR